MGEDRRAPELAGLPFSTDRISCRADYDRVRSNFRWECPENFNFGFDVVDAWAAASPKHVALHWVGPGGERRVTYSELAERSGRFAQAVTKLPISHGDRVLVILPRVPEWWEILIGLLKAGVVAIPGTTLLTAKDLTYRIGVAGVSAVITDAEGAEKFDAIASQVTGLKHRILVGKECRAGWISYEEVVALQTASLERTVTRRDDPALVYFTSGTTGMPKMVLHTHASYGVGHQITGRFWLDLHPEDLHWNVSDTGWAKAAWSSLFGPLGCGARLFVHHTPGKFQPADVLDCLSRYPITTLCAAPTIYRWLVKLDLGSFRPAALRHCVAAGEPLNPEVINVWKRATGLTIRDGYGQTETVLLCGNFPGVEVRPGSMGLPSPGFELAAIDDEGRRKPIGEDGDLALRIDPNRPLGLFQQYWKDPQATTNAFRQGWYRTGDCGHVDADGYFWFASRADDVINSSAYRIGPFEVESALVEHKAVVEAAVVGKPDPERGEIVKAFVVLAKGYQPSEALKHELQEHVKHTTAPYKYPREIEFVDELPKTVSGKIRRVELRNRG
jgi:acetyl-CoA synthetase/medium-chain acyl-CoA synthetase